MITKTPIDLSSISSSLSDKSIAATISLTQTNDLKKLKFKFNHYTSRLASSLQIIDGIDSKILISFEEFVSRVNEVFEFAPSYDYKDIPSNGYRSLLKIWTSMMEISVKEFEHNHEYTELMVVVERMNKWFKILNESNDMVSKDVHDHDLGKEHLRLLFDLTDEESMRIFLGEKLIGLACHPVIRSWIKLAFRAVSLFGTGSVNKTIKCLWTYEDALQHYVSLIRNLTPNTLASLIRVGDWTVSKKIASVYHVLNRGFYRVNKCSAKSIHPMISSPYLIKVTSKGSHLEVNTQWTQSKRVINCRVCTTKSSFSSKKVMMYLHGGAFFGLSGEILEHLYLKDWAEEIPGLTIISVNYSLCPENKFPVALQEVVDFYLWLTSGTQEVIDLIDFHPEQIIISGDSSGGNLAAASLMVLNDIKEININNNNNYNQVAIKRPTAIVLFYPKIMLRMEMLPSTLLTNFDLIINQCIQLTICESYLPLIKRGTISSATENSSIKSEKLLQSDTEKDGKETWTLLEKNEQPPKDWLARPDYDVIRSPYLTPYAYTKFDELSDVKLSILAFDCDPFLDESITMAKKWKGNVDLKTFDHLPHGSFVMKYSLPAVNDCITVASQMIQESFS